MIVRAKLVMAIFVGMALVGTGGALATSGPPTAIEPELRVAAAPAAIRIGDFRLSQDVNDQAEPINARADFDEGTSRVWVSFEYADNDSDRLRYQVRRDGRDFVSRRDLDCCAFDEGRFAFSIEQENGGLRGGTYEVTLYEDNSELRRTSFIVRGGGDNDNRDSDDNDNVSLDDNDNVLLDDNDNRDRDDNDNVLLDDNDNR